MVGIKQAEVLTRLIQRLTSTTALTDLVPAASIRNYLPQVSAADAYQGLPYIRARLDDLSQYDTKSSTGYDVRAVIDCWTGPPDLGDLKAHQIADEVMQALQGAPLVFSQGQCILAQHIGTITITENDGRTTHAVVSFRLLATD